METKGIERFIEVQEKYYDVALKEIENGKKESHWMWFIFPQIKGLGASYNSNYYGIRDLDEAREYLEDDYLGGNLVEISSVILGLDTDNIEDVLGDIDSKKLQSCMTLFGLADPDYEVFFRVLDKYYDSAPCEKTMQIVGE